MPEHPADNRLVRGMTLASAVAHQLRHDHGSGGGSRVTREIGDLLARSAAKLASGDYQAVVDLVLDASMADRPTDVAARDNATIGSALVVLARAHEALGHENDAQRVAGRAVQHLEAAAPDLTPPQRIDLGRALTLVQRPAEAAAHLRVAVDESEPVAAETLRLLAQALEKSHDLGAAMHTMERAVAAEPRDETLVAGLIRLHGLNGDTDGEVAARLAAAWGFIGQEEHENALTQTNRALSAAEGSPLQVDVHVVRAAVLEQLHGAEAALASMEEAGAILRGNGVALAVHADLLRRTGGLDAALRLALEAVEVEPGNALVHATAAQILSDARNLERALVHADQAVGLDTSNAHAWTVKGEIHLGLMDSPAARDALNHALSMAPESAHVHALLGRVCWQEDDPANAIVELDRALALAPDYAFALGMKAELLRALDEDDDAADCYRRLLRVEPAHAYGWAQLAYLRWQVDDKEAERAADRALALDPDQPTALLVRTALHLAADNWQEAVDTAERALRLDSHAVLLHLMAGEALINLDQRDRAADHLHEAVEITPTFANEYAFRGRALELIGRPQDAVEAYDRALEMDATLRAALSRRARLLLSADEPEKALADLERLVEIDPQDGVVLKRLADLLQLLGRNREALATLDAALDIDAADPEVWATRADILRAQGRSAEALEAAERALASDRAQPTAYVLALKGDALTTLGRHDEGLVALDQALTLDPTHAFALVSRAVALQQLDQHARALDSVQQSLEVTPSSAWALAVRNVILHDIADFRGALETADELLGMHPDNAFAHGRRGMALLGLGGEHLEASLEAFERAVRLEPEYPGWLNGCGEAHHFLEDDPAAERSFRQVIDRLHGRTLSDEELPLNLAWAHYRLDEADKASDVLRSHVAVHSADLSVRFFVALTFLAGGRPGTGMVEYERAVQVTTARTDALRRHGLALDALSDLHDGVRSGLVADDSHTREAVQMLNELRPATPAPRLG